jgi:glyceraldehyde-3-phosphate dehydrogenase (NADP+)
MKKLSSYQKYQILNKVALEIERNKDKFSELIAKEAGKPIMLARGEVNRAILTFTIAAEESKRIYGEVIPLDIDSVSVKYKGYWRRFPVGIVLAISPFNFPLNLVAHKVAPAIAAGNAVIIKPSPYTPLTACLLGEMLLNAGLPAEAISIVHCDNEKAEKLVRNDAINLLSFTGSAQVGWHLKTVCGKKKVILEMGGNAASIVTDTADLAWASNRLALGAFAYSGQICISVQRVYVFTSIYEKFLDLFITATSRLKVGNVFDEDTIVGPMITKSAIDRVEDWLKEAIDSGAQFLIKGIKKDNILYPNILIHADSKMKIYSEEVFGPVVLVEEVKDIDEAIMKVNNSRYGLQASVFTNEFDIINKAIEEINVGGLIINDYPTLRIDNMPYGGLKDSGFGREGVKYAVEGMTEKKMIVWQS